MQEKWSKVLGVEKKDETLEWEVTRTDDKKNCKGERKSKVERDFYISMVEDERKRF